MSLNIDREFFEITVSSAREATGRVFEAVQGYLTEATQETKEFLGVELFNLLDGERFQDEPDFVIAEYVKQYICFRAYEIAIPHLDLVLTPTGFGIVSNQNLTPASAERVNRLIHAIKDMKEMCMDNIIYSLRGHELWCDTPYAIISFSTLLWHSSQLIRYGVANPTRAKLREARPKITQSESRLKELISPEFHKELCDSVRCKTSTPLQESAITLCLNLIAHPDSTMIHRKALLQFLHAHLEDFQTYANSTAYQANNFKSYENAVNDSCYFFG